MEAQLLAYVNHRGRGVALATVTARGLSTEAWGLLEPPAADERSGVGDDDVLVVSAADASHPNVALAVALGFRVNVIPALPDNFRRLLESRGAVVVGHHARKTGLGLTVYYPDSNCYFSAPLSAHTEALRRRAKLGGLLGRVAPGAASREWPAGVEAFATATGRRGWGREST